MKAKKTILIWAAVALTAAALAAVVILTGLFQGPAVQVSHEAVQNSAQSMMDTLKSGDREALSARLYGNPKLDSLPEDASPAERLIWQAYLNSLDYYLGEAFNITGDGVELEMTLYCLDIPALVDSMKASLPAFVAQKAEELEDDSVLYDENNNLRPEFLEQLLLNAAQSALADQPQIQAQELMLECRRLNGQWLVVPTEAVQSMLSGFITEGR